MDGVVLILGKAEDGLDRAVRKYANAVSCGQAVEDTVYHEGYRIERFTLFGKDISEYTIVYSDTANANMELAATDLQKLILKACGAELELVKGEFEGSPAIRIEHSDKEELKVGGFEYFEKHGYSSQKLPTLFDIGMADNIWEEAYIEWLPVRGDLPAGDSPEQPFPDEHIPETTATETLEASAA